jgi:hypothetical protein
METQSMGSGKTDLLIADQQSTKDGPIVKPASHTPAFTARNLQRAGFQFILAWAFPLWENDVAMIDQYDNLRIYCRILGHEVPFSYCRQGAFGQPCRRIFDCWFEKFDIQKFMQEHFTQEQIQALLAPPTDKVVSLIELIRKAQQNAPDVEEKG